MAKLRERFEVVWSAEIDGALLRENFKPDDVPALRHFGWAAFLAGVHASEK